MWHNAGSGGPVTVRSPASPADPAPQRSARESPGLAFRTDIEGLRALAVLLVVAYHASLPGIGGGFIGVDVFFVLSGYLITTLLTREVELTGGIRLGSFYARRIRRLLPAAAMVVFVTLAAGVLLYPPHVNREMARTAAAAGAYVSNLWLARRVGDYFGSAAESDPLLHMWSLSVEEQFYLLWPVAVLLVLRGAAPRLKLALVMAGLILFSLAGSWWYSIVSRPTAFFQSPLRAWEFAAGGLLSLAPTTTRLGARTLAGVRLLGLVAVLWSALTLSARDAFPGFNAVPVVAGTLLLLWPGHVRGSGPWWLTHPSMQRLGTLSYSWYLWHWPALAFLSLLAPGLGWGWRCFAAAAALLPAAAAYRYVEDPIRRNRWLSAAPRRSLSFGAALTAVVVSVSLGAWLFSASVAESPEYQAITEAAGEGPIERDGCVATFVEDVPIECVYGDGTAPLVILLGDSHASQWGAGLIPAVQSRGGRLVVLTKSSCPTADFPVTQRVLGRRFVECERWRERAFLKIAALGPDLVVLANSAGYMRDGLFLGPGDPYAAWEAALREAVRQLAGTAERVVILQDTPWIGRDVPSCLAAALRPLRTPATCSRPQGLVLDGRMAGIHEAVASAVDNAHVLDFTRHFCATGSCPAVVEGIIAYRDRHHISAAMAASLEAEFATLIDAVRRDQVASAPRPRRR